MKYLKKFENIEKYEIEDYVLIDLISIKNNYFKYTTRNIHDNFAKIINIYNNDEDYNQLNVHNYILLFDNGEQLDVETRYIIKKLTNNELSEYRLKNTANKFNI